MIYLLHPSAGGFAAGFRKVGGFRRHFSAVGATRMAARESGPRLVAM